MKIWLDAQLSPRVGEWIGKNVQGVASTVALQSDAQLRSLPDEEIFRLAREESAIVMTKDRDFVEMVERHGPPPQVLWLTCGNTSNQALQTILAVALPEALKLLRAGEPLVEITDI